MDYFETHVAQSNEKVDRQTAILPILTKNMADARVAFNADFRHGQLLRRTQLYNEYDIKYQYIVLNARLFLLTVFSPINIIN